MTVENEPPKSAPSFLNQQQLRLSSALREENLFVPAEAYETAAKVIYFMKNGTQFDTQLLSEKMAACFIGHLVREIVAFLMREVSGGRRVQYVQMFDKLKVIWSKRGFNLDGNNYFVQRTAANIAAKLPIELMAFFVKETLIKWYSQKIV